ncbi:MAG: hypothetical protein AAGG09_15020 [Pseudomonadota bacterium]
MTRAPRIDDIAGRDRPTAAQQAADSPLLQALVARYLRPPSSSGDEAPAPRLPRPAALRQRRA